MLTPRPLRTLSLLALLAAPAGGAGPRPTSPAPIPDQGVFPDLAAQVRLPIPPWLRPDRPVVWLNPPKQLAVLTFDGAPVSAWPARPDAALPAHIKALPGVVVQISTEPPGPDTDGDGLPDLIDLRAGARKAALNAAEYRATYARLDYPGGDVDRHLGVCTDVVIRALRNAGPDLQVILAKDMAAHPTRYGLPAGARGNAHIDHRRVRRLLPWFKAHAHGLPTRFDAAATGEARWLPGDIVFMDTLGGPGPDHIGLMSDRADPDGRPLIINNWTDGYRTGDMALLGRVPVTHRFRWGLKRHK